MSLKAKIEAVIYASEEPVTLQQLVGLLGQEAQAELDAADARQGQLALDNARPVLVLVESEPGDHDALNAETLGDDVIVPPEPAAPDDAALFAVSHPEPLATDDAERESQDAPEASETATANDRETTEPETVSGEAPEAEPQSVESARNEESDQAVAPSQARAELPSPPSEAPEPTPAELRARERRLREYMRFLLDELVAEYRDGNRGLEIREIAGGFRFATKPEYHDAVRGFVRSLKPPLKLSLQALETLAVVAYKQPVTAPEVSEIRGVDSSGVLGSLIGRKLVATAGRKQVIGRPILYKTTKEFLLRFGLKDLNELPSIEEFERLASEMNEAVQEEIPMAETLDQMKPAGSVGDASRNLEPNRDVHDVQPDGIPDGPSDPDSDDEMLLHNEDAPGEFTGNASASPVDNASIDGRQAGVPPNYDPSVDEMADSPAGDAAIQSEQGGGNQ